MFTLSKDIEHEIIINKSRFITNICVVSSEVEAREFVNKIKNKYSDASHNCSVYILGAVYSLDDDGEPSRTAAYPMFNVLEKQKINNVCAVVTRYFGGIKLGSGGLTRAYSNAISETLLQVDIIKQVLGFRCMCICPISDNSKVSHVLKNANISVIKQEFMALQVRFEFDILEQDFTKISETIKAINYQISIDKECEVWLKLGVK